MRTLLERGSQPPLANWAYTLWRELSDLPSRKPSAPPSLDPGIRFSVLMPVYNPKPEHLRAAVDSLMAQTWPHWELCMADDASPDPAIRPLLRELTALDPRIRVEFRERNGHIAAATNTALNMARHEFAAFMDQDDLLTPDALAEMAEAAVAHPHGQLFYSDEDKILDDGTIILISNRCNGTENSCSGKTPSITSACTARRGYAISAGFATASPALKITTCCCATPKACRMPP